jgi:disulfide bond formation protein DsbB
MLRPDPVPAAAYAVEPASRRPLLLALAILTLAAAAILGALAFQHIGGYQPCALCLMQRTPYYVGIPLAAAAALAAWARAPRLLTAAAFGLFAALMAYNAGLAVYHSGVERKLWEGPASCAPSTSVTSAGDMLGQLEEHPPSCTDITFSFLGVTFANANALISLALSGLAAAGAAASLRRYGSSTASQ